MTNNCTQCGARLSSSARFCGECGAPVKPERRSRRASRANQGQWLTTPVIVLILGSLLLAGGGGAYLLTRLNPTPEVSLPQGPRSAGIPYPEVERIPLADAKARYDSGTALFLDVRIIESYERAHIPNAVSMPLALLATRHQQLAGAEEILTYCT
jgi:hypothetical protein